MERGLKNTLKSVSWPIRAAILAVTLLAALVATIAPASAHTPIVSGKLSCGGNDTQVITWSVGNSQTGAGQDMTVVSATASQGTVAGLPSSVPPGGTVTGTTTLPASATGSVTLTVHGHWNYDGFDNTLTSTSVSLGGVCADVTVAKTDDHQPPNPVSGAVFGLFTNAATTGAPLSQCTTSGTGECAFPAVVPGAYWVKELSAPTGYTVDPSIKSVAASAGKTKSVSFIDARDTGFLHIVKKLKDDTGVIVPSDPHVLDGTSFVVYQDANHNGTFQSNEQAFLWPAGTTPAGCAISGGTGACDIGPLATGAYRVHETVAPAGTVRGDDVDVTVVKGAGADPTTVLFTNKLVPLDIHLDKSGPAFAHVGDTYTYTFTVTTAGPSLHGVQLQDTTPGGCTTVVAGPSGDTGNDGILQQGETWTYQCTHTVAAADHDPYVNTAKVTGTDDFGRTKTATSQHTVDILHPAITLDKKVNGGDHATAGDALQVHAGNTVSYTVVATNTSADTPMTVTALSDDHSSSVPSPSCDKGLNAVLQPGDTIHCTYTSPISADTHNVASITAKDALGMNGDPKGVASASDGTFVKLVHPAIKIEKSGPAVAHVGDTVTYSFKVTNTGDTTLNNVAVTDNVLGSIGTIPSLAPGASTTLTKAFTIPPNMDPVDNTGTACGRDALTGPNDPATCGDDHHHLDVLHPALAVDKKVNGADHATNADALEVHSGDTVTYTVVATNTSPDTPMTVTAFIDDHSSTVPSPACDKGIGTVLQPNETIHCTYAASISDDVHNVVSITAKDSLGLKGDPNGVITKTDGTFVKVLNPNIDVVKSANKPAAHDGDLVTYSFKVTNKGDVRLTGVKVTDDVLGDIGTIASLDAGASQTLTKDFTVPAGTGDVVNHVQACGNDPLDKQVCDTDSHNLPRIHPAITLDKKVNGADHATAAGALQVHAGDTVTYSIVAKNTSPDTPLTVTAFSDDHSTTVPNPSCDKGMNAVLQPNETITCAYTAKITDNVHNVASITAKDPLGLTGDPKGVVSATDGTFVQVIHPAISVVKSGPATATAGQTVTYGFKVTNTGDIALSNVQVSDDKLGAVGTIPALAVGESTTLTKDFTVPAGQTAIDNTVTACGSDVLSLQVCATDTHHMDVTQVLGENVVRPTAPLAVTGADLGWRSLIGLLLLAGGVGLRVMRRRTRRSEA